MTSTEPRALTRQETTVLLLAAILLLLDSSLINVLLPNVAHSLGAPAATVQWGVSGYLLAAMVGIVGSIPTLARFGARTVGISSVVLFGLASVLVGASGTPAAFVAARVVQGLACGFIMPAVQQLAADIVGRSGMRAALATVGLPAVVAPAFGPLLGGVFVGAVGWRALFFINVPLVFCIGVMGAGRFSTQNAAPTRDTPKAAGLGFRDLTHLARSAVFVRTMLVCFIAGAVFYGTLLLTSLDVQVHLRAPAWWAGLVLGVQGVGAWIARSLVKGRWKDHNAFGLLSAGLLVASGAIAAMGSVVAAPPVLLFPVLFGGAFVRGLGLGVCTLLALSSVYEVVDRRRTAIAGSLSRLMLQVGGAAGTSLAGTGGAVTVGFVCLALVGAAVSWTTYRAQVV